MTVNAAPQQEVLPKVKKEEVPGWGPPRPVSGPAG